MSSFFFPLFSIHFYERAFSKERRRRQEKEVLCSRCRFSRRRTTESLSARSLSLARSKERKASSVPLTALCSKEKELSSLRCRSSLEGETGAEWKLIFFLLFCTFVARPQNKKQKKYFLSLFTRVVPLSLNETIYLFPLLKYIYIPLPHLLLL